MDQNVKNIGWRVTFAGTGINLALGILYTWSIIKAAIPASWGWDPSTTNDPYAIACFVFAIAMIPAGRLQDRIGPRWVATIGGALTGIGCLIAGLIGFYAPEHSYIGFVIGFGVLAGIGIGFGYATATPAAVKWFPASKTGVIAGTVVAGFGLASVYIAPLGTFLINTYNNSLGKVLVEPIKAMVLNPQTGETVEKIVQTKEEFGVPMSMILFGAGFLIIVMGLAQLLKNPPAGYKPVETVVKTDDAGTAAPSASASKEVNWKQMLSKPQFYILWLMFACGSAAGLMVISVASPLGNKSLGEAAFWAVAMLAIGNAGGRILSGFVSDWIGRQWTMLGFFLLQAITVVSLIFVQSSAVGLLVLIFLAGANYGSNLTLFPSATKDYFGLKGFGLNYGIMFTAWGFGGLILPRIAAMVKDATGKDDLAFYIAGGLMLFASALTFVSRAIAKKTTNTEPGQKAAA